jgi:hypothetical protein
MNPPPASLQLVTERYDLSNNNYFFAAEIGFFRTVRHRSEIQKLAGPIVQGPIIYAWLLKWCQ